MRPQATLSSRLRYCLLTLLAGSLLMAPPAGAQFAEPLSYQGYLADNAGTPIDEPVLITFALYNVAIGGAPLWSEVRSVIPRQGLFSETLGEAANPFPAGLFDTPLWLGVTIGADAEMTPRQALTAAPFAHKAADAGTVGGMTAFSLDQSGDVVALQGSVGTLTSSVASLNTIALTNQGDISGLQGDLNAAEADIVATQADVSAAESDISVLQTDVTGIENTLPTLQTRVTGVCGSGSAIRSIASNGTVTCEIDDGGLWSTFNNNVYFTTGSVGIGTSAPAASLMIDAPVGTDPFRARVQNSTKLRVHENGSVSVGTSSAGSINGLYVLGPTQVGAGTALTSKLSVYDPSWQMALSNTDVGGGSWYFGSSADAWAAGGGKLIINNSNNSGSSKMAIDSSGNVGIDNETPATRLHILGGSDVSAAGGGYLTVGGLTGANIAMDSNEIMARSNGSVATLNLNAEGGEVRINSGGSRDSDSLEVRGKTYFDNGGNSGMIMGATDSSPTNATLYPSQYEEALIGYSAFPFWRVYSREFYAQTPLQYKTYSDRSLKSNIQPVADPLGTLMQITGVSYELDKHPMDKRDRTLTAEQEYDRTHQLGFIAQDLEKVLPQLVSEDEDSGLKTVGYMGVIPILVEAIKAQQHQIDAQSKEIAALKEALR